MKEKTHIAIFELKTEYRTQITSLESSLSHLTNINSEQNKIIQVKKNMIGGGRSGKGGGGGGGWI